jgi:hypothetical protein
MVDVGNVFLTDEWMSREDVDGEMRRWEVSGPVSSNSAQNLERQPVLSQMATLIEFPIEPARGQVPNTFDGCRDSQGTLADQFVYSLLDHIFGKEIAICEPRNRGLEASLVNDIKRVVTVGMDGNWVI